MSVVLFVAALILVPFFLGLIWLGLYAAYFMSMAHMLMRVGLKIGHLIALGSLITVMFAIVLDPPEQVYVQGAELADMRSRVDQLLNGQPVSGAPEALVVDWKATYLKLYWNPPKLPLGLIFLSVLVFLMSERIVTRKNALRTNP